MRVDRGALALLTVFGSIAWSVYAAVSRDSAHDPWTLGALEGRIEAQPAVTNVIEDRHGNVLARPVFIDAAGGDRWVIERPYGRPMADVGLGRETLLAQGIQGNLAGVMRTGGESLRPYSGEGGWARTLLGDPTLTAPTMPVVRTTIEADLNVAIYQLLAERYGARGRRTPKASVVVLHAPTGEVRAIVDYPGPDVDGSRIPDQQTSLDALHGQNLPASTMKVLSAAYLLTFHNADADNAHPCTGDRCWARHGIVRNLQDAVVRSCNTWFRIESAGWDRGEWLEFVMKTGLQPPDTPGLPLTPVLAVGHRGNRMHWPQAVGQQIWVSLVGLTSAYATVTSMQGLRVNPVVLEAAGSPAPQPEVVGPEVSATIRHILWATGRAGTAQSVNRAFKQRNAGAKTGTGERDGATSDAVFLAVAPWDHPEWVVAVSIKGGGSGSSIGSLTGEILNRATQVVR